MIELYNDDNMNILKNLPDGKYCIVTDPPFNVGYHYGTYKDRKPEEVYKKWISDILRSLNSPFVLIHYPEAIYKQSIYMQEAPERVVSWVYNSNTAKQHRDIAYFGIKPDFSLVKQPYKNPNDKRVKELIARGSTGTNLYDWWNVNQVKNVSKEKTGHPCQMPLEIMLNAVGIIPNDYIIVDPFMGSGTTGEACGILERDFIGIEMDASYFEIAKKRLEKY